MAVGRVSLQAAYFWGQHEAENDPITGLKQKTKYGKPIWVDEFRAIGANHPEYVQQCGTPSLQIKK